MLELDEIRSANARVKLITDGDVSASIEAALPETDVDVLMGIGGTPEGVLAAAAVAEVAIPAILTFKALAVTGGALGLVKGAKDFNK